MGDFEEALQNIDIFCKVLVKKLLSGGEETANNVVVEPMERLMLRKYVIEEHLNSSPLGRSLIPLPQVEEPLVDIFEHDNYVKVLMQCRCKEQKVTVHTDIDGIEICKRECRTNSDGVEVCTDKCQKINIPVGSLEIENMITKCSNNTVFELEIPKKQI